MKPLRIILALFIFICFSHIASAQDVVVIDSSNNVRGTIKGADYFTVTLVTDDNTEAVYKAKDVQQFLWNGETYISKAVMNKNKMEPRFFKVLELGTVNLYSIGESNAIGQKKKRLRFTPEVGIGIGSGGYGGFGFGGGISIGGGRRDAERAPSNKRALYFIEKPGSGPMEEIQLNGGSKEEIRQTLLSKLNNDEDLAERIKDTDNFDTKTVTAFVKAYNLMHK